MVLMRIPFLFLSALISTSALFTKESNRDAKGLTIHEIRKNGTTFSTSGMLTIFDGKQFTIPTSIISAKNAVSVFTGVNTLATVSGIIMGILLFPFQIAEQLIGVAALKGIIGTLYGLFVSFGFSDAFFSHPKPRTDDVDTIPFTSRNDDHLQTNSIFSDYHNDNYYDNHKVRSSSSFRYDAGPSSDDTWKLSKIASTVGKTAARAGAAVWHTTFGAVRALSDTRLGHDVSKFASRFYKRYSRNNHRPRIVITSLPVLSMTTT